jgi:hypothetical protein
MRTTTNFGHQLIVLILVYCGSFKQWFILGVVHLLFSNINNHLIHFVWYLCGCTFLWPLQYTLMWAERLQRLPSHKTEISYSCSGQFHIFQFITFGCNMDYKYKNTRNFIKNLWWIFPFKHFNIYDNSMNHKCSYAI